MTERVAYDEMAYFGDNAAEMGLTLTEQPEVVRCTVELGDGRRLSGLRWGGAPPELVLLHGGAQNAHTWDSMAIALGRPLVALDLPGHGHSDGPRRGALDVGDLADDVAIALRALAPDASGVIGMSLGGLTALALSQRHPALVRALVLVDITPGVTGEKSSQISAFVQGPETFASFEDLLARTIEFNPTRTESSLRRGILHNAEQLGDGSWRWRHARHRTFSGERAPDETTGFERFHALWDAVDAVDVPLLLVRGMRPQSVVNDADEAELLRRAPKALVVHVADAGHSVQGDTPLELARIIDELVFG